MQKYRRLRWRISLKEETFLSQEGLDDYKRIEFLQPFASAYKIFLTQKASLGSSLPNEPTLPTL